jgi:mono/diheme cytochrome c family protein
MRKLDAALFALSLIAARASAQDLPAGPGKEIFEKVCSQCHGLDIITNLKHTKAEWQSVIDTMAGYGASAKDEEFEAIVNYLAKNFGKDGAAKLSPQASSKRPSPAHLGLDATRPVR